jgi:glycosyltransferase involved in cell wall biosynthesis
MKRILVLNFFPAFVPPSSGGELRYFHLYSQVSKHFDVTLLSPTYSDHPEETLAHSTTFRERRIPKEPIHDQIHQQIGRLHLADEISALVCSLSARRLNRFHEAYLELEPSADLIIHESPYMLEYDLLLGLDGRPRIYNSYNVEADLVDQIWRGPGREAYLAHISRLESRLVNESGLCFAVSGRDAARFCERYGVPRERFRIAENGISIEEYLPRISDEKKRSVALFFGSFHPPNISAANFILTELAPAFPQVDFVIAGNCLSPTTGGVPGNVRLLGRVDNGVRLGLFASSDVALNPMFAGSGTNLKSLEYLAAGLPLVTTEIGSRGLDLVHRTHALIASKDEFASALREILADRSLAQSIAHCGRGHVATRFSWEAIGAKVVGDVDRCLNTWNPRRRRRLLLLNDFPVSRPTSGGEVRINRIYSAIAQSYDVVHLCLTDSHELRAVEIGPNFIELPIPKSEDHRKAESRYAWHVSAADILNYRYAPLNLLLQKLAKTLHRYCDIVILSHPYMVGLLAPLMGRPILYEALNVETTLKKSLLVGHPAYGELVASAEECERAAIACSASVLLAAESDSTAMRSLGAHTQSMHVIPNGVDVPARPADPHALDQIREALNGRPMAVFIASSHPPNVEAARYISEVLAPQMPDVLFGLIGTVCEALPNGCPPNLLRFGHVDDAAKDILVELADVALNPMVSGSGSNLKLADYFAKCRATVTTQFGARGYDITDGEQALVCSLENFPERIRLLLQNPGDRDLLGRRAYAFAKANLDWNLQAQKVRKVLDESLATAAKPRLRLLVVTYRFTNPPMGGAETYLLQLLRQLAQSREFEIDVATTSATNLSNQYHFSCRYDADPDRPISADPPWLRVLRFPIDVAEGPQLEQCRHLWTIWNAESLQIAAAHLDKLPDAVLLGGWYYPEVTQSGICVWASPSAELRVRNLRALTLRGYSPQPNRLTVRGDSRTLATVEVDGSFQVTVETLGTEVIRLQSNSTYLPPADPRPLGILVNHIACISPAGTHALSLDVSYRDVLRRVAPSDFIATLIRVAEDRSASIDDLFQRLRGPNSQALERWLKENTKGYDVVLGHSIPFKTAVLAAQAAETAAVPLVQLPHFHLDDEFYHWASYYAALRRAKVCITFPKAAIPWFFDRIGAHSVYLSHGPVSVGAPSPDDEATFEKLYASRLPFVLVLGRKDRAKNYPTTIEAVGRINTDRHRCNVVMIGPDEDGVALNASEVTYLGPQPKGIVLSALRRCLCLVSMSESESFGIVVLEAWAQARPVVVSDGCVASAELVTDGETGFLADPANLHSKILVFLDQPHEADRMGRNGKATLSNEFSWETIGSRFRKILLELSPSQTPHH